MSKISYCTTVCERSFAVLRMLKLLQDLEDRDFELILVDHASSDIDYSQCRELQDASFDVKLVQLGLKPFNRSVGLNAAADNASGSYLFFTDCDMRFTPRFNELIRENVSEGVCWFPICYSLHEKRPPRHYGDSPYDYRKSNGWWRAAGWGMCGFMPDDFHRLRWDEVVGRTYGREDVLLSNVARKKLTLRRDRCHDLYHVWHPWQRNKYLKRKRK